MLRKMLKQGSALFGTGPGSTIKAKDTSALSREAGAIMRELDASAAQRRQVAQKKAEPERAPRSCGC